MSRKHVLEELSTRTFDLLVIGGGITGAGIAREASLRGLSVALVEARDFAAGTSSRSTKLIHGGLRYLKNMDFKLVRESVQERMRLIEMAPHLVRVLRFLFPVYAGDPDSLFALRIGLTFYDLFAGSGNPVPHRILSPDRVREQEPLLRPDHLNGGGLYCDCATNDGRLTLEVLLSAVAHGAQVANYTEVTSFLYDAAGRVQGVQVRDRLTEETFAVRAHKIVAAGGPWADAIRELDDPAAKPTLRLTKGVHLTLPSERLPLQGAVVMRGRDGRMMFAIPAGRFSYVGTTDTDYTGDPEAIQVEWSDVEYILDATRRTFPGVVVTPEDVGSAWAGLRPLVRPSGHRSASATSRDYQVYHSSSGLVAIAGGKLTAFRAMASHIVDELAPSSQGSEHQKESTAPLPGASGPRVEQAELAAWAAASGVTPEFVGELAQHYGTAIRSIVDRLGACPPTQGGAAIAEPVSGAAVGGEAAGAHRPEQRWLSAQLRHAIEHEMALRLEDFLIRRTGLLLFTPGNGREAIDSLATEMGDLLGWPPERRTAERQRCHALVDEMFAWQRDPVLA